MRLDAAQGAAKLIQLTLVGDFFAFGLLDGVQYLFHLFERFFKQFDNAADLFGSSGDGRNFGGLGDDRWRSANGFGPTDEFALWPVNGRRCWRGLNGGRIFFHVCRRIFDRRRFNGSRNFFGRGFDSRVGTGFFGWQSGGLGGIGWNCSARGGATTASAATTTAMAARTALSCR